MSYQKPILAILILYGWVAWPTSATLMAGQLLEQRELKYYEMVRRVVDMTPAELRKAYPDLKRLDPAPSQEDLGPILQKVGDGIQTFIRDFPNTASIEEVRQERLDHSGNVMESRDQTFNYLVLAQSEGIIPGLNEIRTDPKGKRLEPQALEGPSLLTSGFVSMSIHFHPQLQGDSTFRYLGRLATDSHETYVVAFAQKPDAARAGARIEMGNRSGTILVQGIARIDARSYQILRLWVGLLAPRPDLRVDTQTTELRFGEVQFRQSPKGVWLPRDVVVTLDVDGQVFRNSHHYSHFKLFNVEATEKGISKYY
jgi:hypothetical protein